MFKFEPFHTFYNRYGIDEQFTGLPDIKEIGSEPLKEHWKNCRHIIDKIDLKKNSIHIT